MPDWTLGRVHRYPRKGDVCTRMDGVIGRVVATPIPLTAAHNHTIAVRWGDAPAKLDHVNIKRLSRIRPGHWRVSHDVD